MAKGSLSPRQKMINLMYLVFIAMLALNMSKEVLSAFGLLEKKITNVNVATSERNTAFSENLGIKASEQPEQYAAVKAKADEVSVISDRLDDYLGSLKTGMMSTLKAVDAEVYEVQDKPDFLDRRFFKGDKLTDKGNEFVAEMDAYRTGMLGVLGDSYPDIKSSIEANFSTGKVTRRDGKQLDWLNYNYEGFPLIASKTKMTSLQNDIRVTENELLAKMLGSQQTSQLAFTQYNTLLETTKSAYYAGEQFDGGIVLGRKDPNTKPNRVELTLDGRALTPEQYEIQSGKVMLMIGAGSPGDHKIEGNLIFLQDGKEVEIPVNTGFATINKPNSATISADKMNVVYRGVTNPMTIAFDGARSVKASATGLSLKSGTSYEMRPGGGREVTINVTAVLPDGENISDSQTFRIKDIPRPTGTIRGEDGDGGCVRMQRNGLEISSVGALLPDFDFDLKLNVTGFKFKVSGQPTVVVSGRKLNAPAKAALRRARRGETVQIFDINANIANNSGYKLKKISPICMELTN
jgi:gliding motility-associated protein GldM